MLFLWKISQDTNNGWDTFDSAIVVAKDSSSAVQMHPRGFCWTDDGWVWRCDGERCFDREWTHPKNVDAICVGQAADGLKEGEVVLTSFNAG